MMWRVVQGLLAVGMALALGASPLASETRVPASTSTASATTDAWLDLERFLQKAHIRQVRLSPDATRVAYLEHVDDRIFVGVLDLESHRRLAHLEGKQISQLHWSTDGGGLFLETPERLAWWPLDTAGEGGYNTRPRLIWKTEAVDERWLWGVDPVKPRHFLIREQLFGEDGSTLHRLSRLDTSGASTVLYEDAAVPGTFLFDETGRLAVVAEARDEEVVIVRRGTGDERHEIMRCDVTDLCALIALSPPGDQVLVKGHFGGDLRQLAAVDLRTGLRTTVHRDPAGMADLGPIQLDPTTRQPLIYRHLSDRWYVDGATPEVQAHLDAIERQLPADDLRFQATARGPFWLVAEADARLHHRRFYAYDTRTRELREILQRERMAGNPIPPERLLPMRYWNYRASDGMDLHAYVVLPSMDGLAPGDRLAPEDRLTQAPVVAMIHGGPWNQVRPGFNAQAQFLADRGYIVFIPNFRASTGYGLHYIEAARGEFGDGRVLQDILDGLESLFVQGYGDRERVAILGHSFGGFSTLAALALHGEYFRVGIASAPPIDLTRAFEDIADASEHRMPNGLLRNLWIERFFVDLDDRQAVADARRRSPEAHLAKTERPLVILAGAKDAKVDVVDVKHYAAALEALGRDVSLLVDRDSGHGFDKPVLRRAMFHLMERTLAHHLGGHTRPREDPELEAYLERNLSLLGESLALALN